jgi:hypothetical protein
MIDLEINNTRLESFLRLKKGWADGGEKVPTKKPVNIAKKILRDIHPELAEGWILTSSPTQAGGIHLEFTWKPIVGVSMDIIVGKNDDFVQVIGWDFRRPEEDQRYGFTDLKKEAASLVDLVLEWLAVHPEWGSQNA